MKKLKLSGAQELSRAQQRSINGGSGSGPCDSCTQLCHANDDGTYDYGMCPSSTGGTSCHNYCCEAGEPTYWC